LKRANSEKPEPDDFRGEQPIFFNVKGKGLVGQMIGNDRKS